jgi:hypothetical protein
MAREDLLSSVGLARGTIFLDTIESVDGGDVLMRKEEWAARREHDAQQQAGGSSMGQQPQPRPSQDLAQKSPNGPLISSLKIANDFSDFNPFRDVKVCCVVHSLWLKVVGVAS